MLQVGSETPVDRSKSIRSWLVGMLKEQLQAEAGSGAAVHQPLDVEGTDVVHACYSGTAALLNTLAWVESEAYDGRWGVVVVTDVASTHPDGELRLLGQCMHVLQLLVATWQPFHRCRMPGSGWM